MSSSRDLVWYKRDQWDFTMWQMAGRAERSDPDELLYNLYVQSTIKDGYNFVGYINPDYEKVVEAQRAETDPAKRAALVKQCQDILNNDQPYVNYVHQMMDYVYNADVWDSSHDHLIRPASAPRTSGPSSAPSPRVT